MQAAHRLSPCAEEVDVRGCRILEAAAEAGNPPNLGGFLVMVGPSGIEPLTSSVSRKRSPSELRARDPGAGFEATPGIEPG